MKDSVMSKKREKQMIFWRAQAFPYVDSGIGTITIDGRGYIDRTACYVEPVFITNIEEGTKVAKELCALRQDKDDMEIKINRLYISRLKSIAPWLIKEDKE